MGASPGSAPALRAPVAPAALADSSSPDSQEPTPSNSDTGSGDGEEAEDVTEVPAEWHAVQVSLTSRMQILWWASLARKRVQRRQEWQAHREYEDETGHVQENIA